MVDPGGVDLELAYELAVDVHGQEEALLEDLGGAAPVRVPYAHLPFVDYLDDSVSADAQGAAQSRGGQGVVERPRFFGR